MQISDYCQLLALLQRQTLNCGESFERLSSVMKHLKNELSVKNLNQVKRKINSARTWASMHRGSKMLQTTDSSITSLFLNASESFSSCDVVRGNLSWGPRYDSGTITESGLVVSHSSRSSSSRLLVAAKHEYFTFASDHKSIKKLLPTKH